MSWTKDRPLSLRQLISQISSPLTDKERFMSEEKVVTYELEGEIALIGLNRPDKRDG
jgi:hypothetical protein